MRFRRTSPHAWEIDDMHPLFAGLIKAAIDRQESQRLFNQES